MSNCVFTQEKLKTTLKDYQSLKELSLCVLSQLNDIMPIDEFKHLTDVNFRDNTWIEFSGSNDWGDNCYYSVFTPKFNILWDLDARDKVFENRKLEALAKLKAEKSNIKKTIAKKLREKQSLEEKLIKLDAQLDSYNKD